MIHNIGYNSQRDNFSFAGKFPGYWQCFSTCAWMLLSYYVSDITATDDDGLKTYLDDVEDSIGRAGIGEKIKQKYNWITGKTSFWWLVQEAGIKKWLEYYKRPEQVTFRDRNIDFDDMRSIIETTPIILQTKKLGGLPGGHIILLVGRKDGGFFAHDPYGNALQNYVDPNGEKVFYHDNYLIRYTGDLVRCIYNPA